MTTAARTGACACGAELVFREPKCGACERADEQRAEAVAATVRTIPKRYRDAAFDSPELAARVADVAAIARTREAVMSRTLSVVLFGPAGVGKSTLAAALLRASATVRNPYGLFSAGLFVDGVALGEVRAQHTLGRGEAELVTRAMRAHTLVIDELGRARASQWDATVDVIMRRHADESPTIYTTGFSQKELETRFDDGVLRRLFEGAIVIDVQRGRR